MWEIDRNQKLCAIEQNTATHPEVKRPLPSLNMKVVPMLLRAQASI